VIFDFSVGQFVSTTHFRLVIFIVGALAGTVALFPRVVLADCPGDAHWLPTTPSPTFDRPPPHPAADCVFYQPAWQNFLHATQSQNGVPAFLSYPTIGDVFGVNAAPMFAARRFGLLFLAPRALKGSNDPASDAPGLPGANSSTAINAGVRQAGLAGLLIDQTGRPIFYAIHFNSAYADFIRQNKLTSKAAIQNVDPQLEFPKGVVELKSAWQIVPKNSVPPNYFTAQATVPALKRNGNALEIDTASPPRDETVALLAIHVVFVLEGHPEFIWATFEHIDANGMRDLAPAAGTQPSDTNGLPGGIDTSISQQSVTLYKAGTLASEANQFLTDSAMVSAFDQASQTFSGGGKPLQTSIYRIFPASKTTDAEQDEDVTDLNNSMASLFAANAPNDLRRNYQLVGAIWMDKPDRFAANMSITNPPGLSTDDPMAIVAGEDGLSSMSMESFTQNSFVNCFSCHDTHAVKDLAGNVVVPAKKLNVSHILSKFVSESK
jgi:hypothetical protein